MTSPIHYIDLWSPDSSLIPIELIEIKAFSHPITRPTGIFTNSTRLQIEAANIAQKGKVNHELVLIINFLVLLQA
jgi:hypothetical protein